MDHIKTPLKAIRAHCIDCCAGSANEVKWCVIQDCELYPFRFGKNPYRKTSISEEEVQRRKERGQALAQMRKTKTAECEVSHVIAGQKESC